MLMLILHYNCIAFDTNATVTVGTSTLCEVDAPEQRTFTGQSNNCLELMLCCYNIFRHCYSNDRVYHCYTSNMWYSGYIVLLCMCNTVCGQESKTKQEGRSPVLYSRASVLHTRNGIGSCCTSYSTTSNGFCIHSYSHCMSLLG